MLTTTKYLQLLLIQNYLCFLYLTRTRSVVVCFTRYITSMYNIVVTISKKKNCFSWVGGEYLEKNVPANDHISNYFIQNINYFFSNHCPSILLISTEERNRAILFTCFKTHVFTVYNCGNLSGCSSNCYCCD